MPDLNPFKVQISLAKRLDFFGNVAQDEIMQVFRG